VLVLLRKWLAKAAKTNSRIAHSSLENVLTKGDGVRIRRSSEAGINPLEGIGQQYAGTVTAPAIPDPDLEWPANAKLAVLIHNERTKMLANALDRASTSFLTVGIATPVAGRLYGLASLSGWYYLTAMCLFAAISMFLHLLARRIMGGLKDG
jgi:hypothetical protein